MTRLGMAGMTALLLLATALAGCSGGGGDDVVVLDARSDPGAAVADLPVPTPREGRGHIAGYVVDASFHTMEDVLVRLPAVDLEDLTNRNGEFEFVDLVPGSYLLEVNATGYERVRARVDVAEDRFTRLQIVLHALPPADPYHRTEEHRGIAPTTGTQPGLIGFFDRWTLGFEPTGIHTLVVEAIMDDHPAGGWNGFSYRVDAPCCGGVAGDAPNPLRAVVPVNGTVMSGEELRMEIAPHSYPAPEVDKEYKVYVTAFYHGPPPEGWSFLAGDP